MEWVHVISECVAIVIGLIALVKWTNNKATAHIETIVNQVVHELTSNGGVNHKGEGTLKDQVLHVRSINDKQTVQIAGLDNKLEKFHQENKHKIIEHEELDIRNFTSIAEQFKESTKNLSDLTILLSSVRQSQLQMTEHFARYVVHEANNTLQHAQLVEDEKKMLESRKRNYSK